MRTELNRQGRLLIIAETEMEGYALKHWHENYLVGTNESTLQIDFSAKLDLKECLR